MKLIVENYTFDASEKKVTFTDYDPVVVERVLLITNVTDGIIIYNFADPAKGGTAATNVLTLEYNTTTMDDSDKLQIIYDDADAAQSVVGTVAATVDTSLLATSAKQLPDNHQVTVSNIASTPLITGFATSAKQDTIDASINTLLKPASTLAAVTAVGTLGTITNVVHVDDNGGALTVDGTVTANLSATDNAVLDDIAANQTDASQKTQIVDGAGNVVGSTSNALDVAIKSGSVTVTGGLTDAELRATPVPISGTVAVTDGGGALTVDGTVAVTNAGLTALAGAISGTEVQVDVLTMPSVAVTGALTDAELRASAVPVSLASVPSHAVTNAGTFAVQATLAAETTKVIGTVNQGTSPWVVSGALTDTELRASAVPVSDGGGALTVDGTVAVTSADIASIKTAVEIIDNIVAGSEAQVDVVTLPVGHNIIDSGTVTTITNVVHVDDNAGSLTIDGTVTANLSATDNAVLDAIAASLAGTLTVTGGGGGEQYADNTVVNAAYKGTLSLGTDGSNYQIMAVDAAGHQQIDVLTMPSTAVTNADITSCKTALELLDNSVDGNYLNVNINLAGTDVAGGNGTTNAQTQRVTISSDSTGQVVLAAGSAAIGKLVANSGVDIGDVTINNSTGAAAVNIQDGGNSITVDGAVTVTNATATNLKAEVIGTGTFAVQATIAAAAASIGKAEDAAHSSGDVGVPALSVRSDTAASLAGATNDYQPLITDSSGRLWVDPQGNVAHDAADDGNPIKIGGRASTTPITAVAANDRVDAFFDVQGRQVVTNKAQTATLSGVSASASSTTLIVGNASRLGATIYNDSSAILYVKFGTTASATSFTVKMQPDSYYEVPFGYYGVIEGIWASATGAARITVIT